MTTHGVKPEIGSAVMVRWSDGGEYAGEVADVQGDQILCRFPNGNVGWVGAGFVRLAERPPPAPAAAAPTAAATANGKHHAVVAAVATGVVAIVIAVGVVLIRGTGSWPLSLLNQDAALSSYTQEVSTALLDAASNKPHDAKWNGGDPTSDLRATDADAKRLLASLGSEPKVVLTTVELEATVRDGAGHKVLRSIAAVLSSGDVRWFVVERKRYDWPETSSTPGLEKAAPVLSKAVERVVREMSASCELPVLNEKDVATLPAELRRQILRDSNEIPRACAPGDTTTGWEAKVDDVTVVVEAGGKWALLKSELKSDGSGMRLAPVQVKVLDGSSPQPSQAVPQPAAPPAPPSAGAVSVGSTVKAVGAGGVASEVRVTELYGKLGKIQYPSGTTEWVSLAKMTPAGTPLPDPRGDSCSVLVGQRVKVIWPYENKKYLARVGEVYGKMARVVFSDDGNLTWAPCDECDPAF